MNAAHEKALEEAALSEGYNALQAFMRLITQKASECAAMMSEDEYKMLCIVGIEKITAVVVPAYLRAIMRELTDEMCMEPMAQAIQRVEFRDKGEDEISLNWSTWHAVWEGFAEAALAADPLRAVLKLAGRK